MRNLLVMPISQKTVGLLSNYLERNSSQATLGRVLKSHGLGDADPGPPKGSFSNMSKAMRVDLALSAALRKGKQEEFISLAVMALDGKEEGSLPQWARELISSLREDGFTSRATTTKVPGMFAGSPSRTETRWTITPTGHTGLPVVSLSSDLAKVLDDEGFSTAAGHYDQALDAFLNGNWAASNAQLRTTLESVLCEIANRRTGSAVTAGGKAIEALAKNGDLPFGPNEYVRGVWKMSHIGGSHPGLSDEHDAQHRMYALSALVGWLVRTYP